MAIEHDNRHRDSFTILIVGSSTRLISTGNARTTTDDTEHEPQERLLGQRGGGKLFNNLKNELTHDQRYQTREQAKAAIFDYIEIFYNRQRIHQTLDYQSPSDFETMNAA